MDGVWLNIGSGGRKLPGFINMDREPGGDMQVDVADGLPFANDSVNGIYCEHFIEHLSQAGGARFLRECRRVLAPDGRLRIATPDLDYVVSKYAGGWRDQAWLRDFGYEWVNNRCECINIAMREWGHRWLYDEEELTRLALYAGLSSPSRCALGASADPHLRGLEWRQDSSLIMEFSKIRQREEAEPLVSILIPAYKAMFFRTALESAHAQTYRHLEIVVCDDSTTDDIKSIVDQYTASDGRIRYSKNSPQLGAYDNHLRCFSQLCGTYVKFLNDDDRLHPLCVERMVHCLRSHPEVTLVTSHRRCMDSKGSPLSDIPATRPIVERDSIMDGAFVASAMLATRLNFLGEPTTVMFRRRDLQGTEPDILSFAGRKSTWNSDVAMWLTLLSKGDAVYLVRSLSDFRLHPDQQSHESGAVERATKAWQEMIQDGLRMGFLDRHWEKKLGLRPLGRLSELEEEAHRNSRASCNAPAPRQQQRGASPSPMSRGRPGRESRDAASTAPGTDQFVSVIIPTFNNLGLTRQCLESLQANTPQPHELIFVDNASTDGTTDFLRQRASAGHVKAICNDRNEGFAKACNQGASCASGQYLLFLNSDTEPHAGWLQPLVDLLQADCSVAAVGSKLLFPDGTIQHAGVIIADNRRLSDPLIAEHIHYRKPSSLPEANEPRSYQALTAACLLVRKSAFEQVGGFDEGYWNGYEDVDLCFKLRQRDWRLVYEPRSVLTHYESMSGPERFSKVRQNMNRLHEKWLGKVTPDIVVEPDGSTRMADAQRIQIYSLPSERRHSTLATRGTEHETKLTSIIILVYNQLEYTRLCLDSIERHTPEPHEIVIVDNGSTDGTRDFLREYAVVHEHARVISNRSNRGFAGGNNQGLALAKGDCVVLLNNDTIVTEGWLGRMLSVFDRHAEVGVVGPMSNYVSGPQLVPEATYGSNAEMEDFAAQWASDHAGQSKAITRVVGFCLAARRAVIDRIGGLDEQFGSGNFEDDDFCIRAALAGFSARIAQDAFVHHHGNRTFIGANIDRRKSMRRNWELFKAKWGITSDTPMEKGYGLPTDVANRLRLQIPLPGLDTTHHIVNQSWWEETNRALTIVLDVGTAETATLVLGSLGNVEAPLTVVLARGQDNDAAQQIRPQDVGLPSGSSIEISHEPLLATLNQAISESSQEPVFLISTDVICPPQTLHRLVAAIRRNQSVAIVGPVSSQAPKPQRIRARYTGTGKELRRFAERRARDCAEKVENVPYLGTFCLAFNSPLCKAVGSIPEAPDTASALWSYFDRVAQSGYKLGIALDTYVHHENLADYEGASFDDLAAVRMAVSRLLAQGEVALERGDLETAETEFRHATESYPDQAAAHAALGSTLMALSRAPEAASSLRRAIELAPGASMLHNQLGVALYGVQDLIGAEAAFKEACKADPKDVQPLLNLIDLYRVQGLYDKSTAALKDALRLDPNRPEVLLAFGTLSFELGDVEGAEIAVQRLQAAAPDHSGIAILREALDQSKAAPEGDIAQLVVAAE